MSRHCTKKFYRIELWFLIKKKESWTYILLGYNLPKTIYDHLTNKFTKEYNNYKKLTKNVILPFQVSQSQPKNDRKRFRAVGFKWRWHKQVQFNTDLLEHKADNLYTNDKGWCQIN